jgi:hypothetical protein
MADGTRYHGGFSQGILVGHGQLNLPNGESYVGEFKHNTFWGNGTFLTADGTKYVGNFENGFRIFRGVVTFPSGDSYAGELRNGSPFGEGMYLGADGAATLQVQSLGVTPVPTQAETTPSAAPEPRPSDSAAHASVTAAQLAADVVAARPVIDELRKFREEWLRLAEARVAQEQELAKARIDAERRRIEEERARLESEKTRLSDERRRQEEALATEIADLEQRKLDNARARDELLLTESRLRQQEQLANAAFERERQRLDEERKRLEAEKARLAQEIQQQVGRPVVEDKRRRVALVIGNATYKEAPLRNPVNDAREVARVLDAAGFKVHVHFNADLKGMRNAVRQFSEDLADGAVGLFYFSGHGAEFDGKNYLIPVNSDIASPDEIPTLSMDADFILRKMTGAGTELSLMILDACRSNPYRGTRASSGGLAPLQAAKGSLIAYATAPGTTASDGVGPNSPYTKHLVQGMNVRGIPMEQMFKQVRAAVVAETRGQQVPWENSSVIGEFYFRP